MNAAIATGWVESTDHGAFLNRLALGDRVDRLFSAMYCREIWSLIKNDQSRTAIEIPRRTQTGLPRRDLTHELE
ncbi:hypothetical protein FRUB_01155 [Fimbriiglobus ruber]|uniref:Uncharacterized protein n=1 Tax=Fimbriiglobus ruber TaxID=1908690 RepID=A0A225EBS4_9BACT|nr:hypothetical protein FRUB_01155 [Fimbriiglobus ruber]